MRTVFKTGIIVWCLIAHVQVFSQIKAGTIHYSIASCYFRSGTLPSEVASPKDTSFSTLSLEFNERYVRQSYPFGTQTNTIVRNDSAKEVFGAFHFSGDNSIIYYYVKDVPETISKENREDNYTDHFYLDLMNRPLQDTIILRTKETKTISGYSCEKTILKIPDGTVINTWTTDSLPELEKFMKISDRVKGTVLMSETANSIFYSRTQFTSLEATNKIDEKQLIPFPEGATLNLGTTHLENGEFVQLTAMGFELPGFIDCSGMETTLAEIKRIIEKSKEMKVLSDDYDPSDRLKFDFNVGKDGEISNIIVTHYVDEMDAELKSTLAELKRNCTFKQVTVNDQVVSFKFSMYYNFPN